MEMNFEEIFIEQMFSIVDCRNIKFCALDIIQIKKETYYLTQINIVFSVSRRHANNISLL